MLFPEYKVDSGATFSPCQKYRYSLWRLWDKRLPILGGLLLNPSTATAETDDPTVYRMGQRARYLGFGGLIICNIFAFRSTNPDKLYELDDPIGPENDRYIMQEMRRCGEVVCGWGKHGSLLNRGVQVYNALLAAGIRPCLLKQNADGSPQHPLYLSYGLKPRAFGEINA